MLIAGPPKKKLQHDPLLPLLVNIATFNFFPPVCDLGVILDKILSFREKKNLQHLKNNIYIKNFTESVLSVIACPTILDVTKILLTKS